MKSNPLLKLQEFGQSIWLDFIRRGILESGELKQLIEEDGLRGVTSNPAIFEKALDDTGDYDEAINTLVKQGKSAEELYRTLTVEDVQKAADRFRPVFEQLGGRDGFVSLEVSPHLAHDTNGTITEARQLWQAADRPNVFIKVPATVEGMPAIRQLIGEGINVNVTLLFGVERYRAVANAYLSGLEDRLKQNLPVDNIASVASFFLSRIDVLIDPKLEKIMKNGGEKAETAKRLHGQVAISSAKIAYTIYQEIYSQERFKKLADNGARTQRLLWASTSTKNPDYSDIKYVEPLIGPDTVNTVPLETLNAYRDHGNPAQRLQEGVEKAKRVLKQLDEIGISLLDVTHQLEDEGVEKFNKPYDKTMEKLRSKVQAGG